MAGGYVCGDVSGGASNPTVACGIGVPSASLGFGRPFAYLAYELIGCATAAGLYRIVHPQGYSSGAAVCLGVQ